MQHNSRFKSIIDELEKIVNSDKFNRNRIEKCYIMLNNEINFFIDELYHYISGLKNYNIVYPITKLRGYCLYIIFSTSSYIKISGKKYREIIEDTLKILDENLEFSENFYK